MRLLNTSNLELKEFVDSRRPVYAILSHVWEEEEVSFQDMQNSKREETMKKKGYRKIVNCCEQAKKDAIDWAWIDTCCIDKSSSAELSEAINSMYQWYAASNVCYVYMADVCNCPVDAEEFRLSRWFTRGWTLQELIAPEHVEFYSRDWDEVGTKTSLSSLISKATRIDTEVLTQKRSPSSFSVAHRMSWAARRRTTRVEDRAYSLLGLFDVNIPLVYGEEHKAFGRLQKEILRREEDYTILLWREDTIGWSESLCAFLASSPDCFDDEMNMDRIHYQFDIAWPEVGFQSPPLLRHGLMNNINEFEWARPIKPILAREPFTPPTFTSRGLRLTLLIKDVTSLNEELQNDLSKSWGSGTVGPGLESREGREILIWTFCTQKAPPKSGLLCLQARFDRAGKLWRLGRRIFAVVQEQEIENFHAEELYLPCDLSRPPAHPLDDVGFGFTTNHLIQYQASRRIRLTANMEKSTRPADVWSVSSSRRIELLKTSENRWQTPLYQTDLACICLRILIPSATSPSPLWSCLVLMTLSELTPFAWDQQFRLVCAMNLSQDSSPQHDDLQNSSTSEHYQYEDLITSFRNRRGEFTDRATAAIGDDEVVSIAIKVRPTHEIILHVRKHESEWRPGNSLLKVSTQRQSMPRFVSGDSMEPDN